MVLTLSSPSFHSFSILIETDAVESSSLFIRRISIATILLKECSVTVIKRVSLSTSRMFPVNYTVEPRDDYMNILPGLICSTSTAVHILGKVSLFMFDEF